MRLLSAQPDKIYPWVFQMEFQLLDGKVWLLKELKESQGERQNVAIASITNAKVSAANGRQTRNQPTGEAVSAIPAEQPAAMTAEETANRGPNVVSGRVTDAQGQPVEGATVAPMVEWVPYSRPAPPRPARTAAIFCIFQDLATGSTAQR